MSRYYNISRILPPKIYYQKLKNGAVGNKEIIKYFKSIRHTTSLLRWVWLDTYHLSQSSVARDVLKGTEACSKIAEKETA